MAPMLTCSNNAPTKANSTRGLIISAHQIGLAHYTEKVLTQQRCIKCQGGYLWRSLNPGDTETIV